MHRLRNTTEVRVSKIQTSVWLKEENMMAYCISFKTKATFSSLILEIFKSFYQRFLKNICLLLLVLRILNNSILRMSKKENLTRFKSFVQKKKVLNLEFLFRRFLKFWQTLLLEEIWNLRVSYWRLWRKFLILVLCQGKNSWIKTAKGIFSPPKKYFRNFYPKKKNIILFNNLLYGQSL